MKPYLNLQLCIYPWCDGGFYYSLNRRALMFRFALGFIDFRIWWDNRSFALFQTLGANADKSELIWYQPINPEEQESPSFVKPLLHPEDFAPLESGHVHVLSGGRCPDCKAVYLYPGWDYSNSTEHARSANATTAGPSEPT